MEGKSADSEFFFEERGSIAAAAREAVRAYYLGEEIALSQAMTALNSALKDLDGIDYKCFAASQLLRILCMVGPSPNLGGGSAGG